MDLLNSYLLRHFHVDTKYKVQTLSTVITMLMGSEIKLLLANSRYDLEIFQPLASYIINPPPTKWPTNLLAKGLHNKLITQEATMIGDPPTRVHLRLPEYPKGELMALKHVNSIND